MHHDKSSSPGEAIRSFERKLNPGNMRKVVRYTTQCIKGLQIAQAFLNLATLYYPGKPISVSFLLHELREAEEFETLGFNFSSKRLDGMSYKERYEIYDERQKQFMLLREPHLNAMREQYTYLAAVAAKQGFPLSFGTILRFSPIHSEKEFQELRAWDGTLELIDDEAVNAKEFALGLLRNEPGWGEILFRKGVFLYDTYSEEVRSILCQKS